MRLSAVILFIILLTEKKIEMAKWYLRHGNIIKAMEKIEDCRCFSDAEISSDQRTEIANSDQRILNLC